MREGREGEGEDEEEEEEEEKGMGWGGWEKKEQLKFISHSFILSI